MKSIGIILLIVSLGCFSCEQSSTGGERKAVEAVDENVQAEGYNDLRKAQSMSDIFCQGWVNKEDARDAEGMSVDSDMEIVYRGYHFFKDGTVVKDPRGKLMIGKYTANFDLKPVTVQLSFGGIKEELQLAYLKPTEMVLASKNGNDFIRTTYVGRSVSHTEMTADPFYKSNLAWRIKPSRRESAAEIKARLKSSIHFYVLFYKEHAATRAKTVSFLGLPSCFKWHAGGISIKKKAELSTKWKTCFYDEADALKAWEMADKLFNRKYDWPKKGNWVDLNAAVLGQIERAIDSIPPL